MQEVSGYMEIYDFTDCNFSKQAIIQLLQQVSLKRLKFPEHYLQKSLTSFQTKEKQLNNN